MIAWHALTLVFAADTDYRWHIKPEFVGDVSYRANDTPFDAYTIRVVSKLDTAKAAQIVRDNTSPFRSCDSHEFTCSFGYQVTPPISGWAKRDDSDASRRLSHATKSPTVCRTQTTTSRQNTRTYCVNPTTGDVYYFASVH